MSELRGYAGESLEFLSERGIRVGDRVSIDADASYEGVLMPRYEGSAGSRLVLKLPSGYNVGIEVGEIRQIRLESRPSQDKATGAEPENNPRLPRLLLLSTGGTIASRIDYRTGAVTPTVSPSELHASVPELAGIANIDAEILFSEYSENLQPENWKSIAERLDQLAGSEYAGIILAHGTDTMQYTAAYLSFALQGYPLPIALVGSQRSSDRPSSDAALNLIGAARFLASRKARGIFVVMHKDESDAEVSCHLGTRVRKMHTSRRAAFQTIGAEPAFAVSGGSISGSCPDFFACTKYSPKITLDTRVALVKYHPGYDPGLLERIIESGVRAIIFEGTGLGHVGRTLYGAIADARRRNIFLGMTSQCIEGRVRMTVYESGRDLLNLGVTPLHDMIPETALVKAMWAAGAASDYDGLKRLMLERTASEFSD